jgi:hypothetical protein
MRVLGLFAVLAVSLCACAKPDVTVPFDPLEAAFIHKPGKGKIQGHAFFRSEKGTVIFAAGEYVYLIPSTAYTDARFASFFGEAKYLKATRLFLTQETDPEYRKFTRNTKAESDGRFTFDNVAAGTYYIWTQATWYADNSILPSGGIIYDKVTVKGDETEPVKVIVSGK